MISWPISASHLPEENSSRTLCGNPSKPAAPPTQRCLHQTKFSELKRYKFEVFGGEICLAQGPVRRWKRKVSPQPTLEVCGLHREPIFMGIPTNPPGRPTREGLISVLSAPFGSVSGPFGSVWLRFGSISGPFRGVGWGRGGVGEASVREKNITRLEGTTAHCHTLALAR